MALGWLPPCGFSAAGLSHPEGRFGHHAPQTRQLGVWRTHSCLKQSPSAHSALDFAAEKHICLSASSASVLLWTHPWPQASVLRQGAGP